MNSTDLQTLLAAPPVSRAAFFTRLLTEPRPRPYSETPPSGLPTDSPTKRSAPVEGPAQPSAVGFLA